MPNLKTFHMPKNYFSWASIVLLLLAVAGFSDNLFYDVRQESNSDPKFVVHGLFFLAWFVMLVVQSNFIRKGDIRAHRKWGLLGMVVALGVILSTFYVFYAVYEGWSAMSGFVKANRIFTLSFAVMVFWAYLKRRNPAFHKRLLLVGTLYVMGPIIDRVGGKLGQENELSYFLIEVIFWNGAFVSLLVYDWKTLRRIHPVTWIGLIWFYVVWVFSWLE